MARRQGRSWNSLRGQHDRRAAALGYTARRAVCPLLRRPGSRTAQRGPGLLRAQHHFVVDEDAGVAPGMHAAEEAEVPLPLLAPIERELGPAGREHGLVPALDDKADLLQQHCRLGRHIDVVPLSDHALDDKDEVPTPGEHWRYTSCIASQYAVGRRTPI